MRDLRHRRVGLDRLGRRARAARGRPRGGRAWPAPMHRRRRWRRPAPPSGGATSTTRTVWPRRRPSSDGVIHLAFQHEVAFRRRLRRRGGGRPAGGRGHGRGAGRLRPALRARLGHGRAEPRAGPATEDDGLVPGAEVRANPAGLRAATALLTLSLRGRRRALVGAALPADGPRRRRPGVRGHLRRTSPASAACPATWATAPTAGPPSTAPTRPAWPAWPSRPRRPARCCTRSADEGVAFRHIAEAHRTASRRPRAVGRAGRRRRALRPPGPLRRARQPGHRPPSPGNCSAGSPTGPEPARGPRPGSLLPPAVMRAGQVPTAPGTRVTPERAGPSER